MEPQGCHLFIEPVLSACWVSPITARGERTRPRVSKAVAFNWGSLWTIIIFLLARSCHPKVFCLKKNKKNISLLFLIELDCVSYKPCDQHFLNKYIHYLFIHLFINSVIHLFIYFIVFKKGERSCCPGQAKSQSFCKNKNNPKLSNQFFSQESRGCYENVHVDQVATVFHMHCHANTTAIWTAAAAVTNWDSKLWGPV